MWGISKSKSLSPIMELPMSPTGGSSSLGPSARIPWHRPTLPCPSPLNTTKCPRNNSTDKHRMTERHKDGRLARDLRMSGKHLCGSRGCPFISHPPIMATIACNPEPPTGIETNEKPCFWAIGLWKGSSEEPNRGERFLKLYPGQCRVKPHSISTDRVSTATQTAAG